MKSCPQRLNRIVAPLSIAVAAALLLPADCLADDKKPKKASTSEAKSSDTAAARKSESKKLGAKRRQSRAPDADRKKLDEQLAESKKAADQVRQSLHTAQKEMAEKADKIKELEARLGHLKQALDKANGQLAKVGGGDFNKLAHALDAERKKNAALQAQMKKMRPDSKPAPAQAAKAKPQPAPAQKPKPQKQASARPAQKKKQQPQPSGGKLPDIAPVVYEPNSAVNYGGRDRVLKEVRAALKKNPKANVEIIGHADDSKWPEVNKEVSNNRAHYLARFLILNGVPKDRVTCRGIGNSQGAKAKDGNRRAEVCLKN